jgi:hypothetical protein
MPDHRKRPRDLQFALRNLFLDESLAGRAHARYLNDHFAVFCPSVVWCLRRLGIERPGGVCPNCFRPIPRRCRSTECRREQRPSEPYQDASEVDPSSLPRI